MTSRNPTCGEALVRLLEAYGVETVFGIPGVHTLDLYRGLMDSPIRHVLARNEQGAAFMADGYARSTGKVGVCFVITGPGVTNASTGIAQAYADSQPVLCISSVGPRATLGKGWGELHEMDDQRAATAPYTAFSATAMSPEEVPGLIHRAFTVFHSQRPRPVHIEIPLDVLALSVESYWEAVALPQPSAPSPDALEEAARLLNAAQKPLILAGGGALGAAQELTLLAEKIAAPVLLTTAGNGAVPDSHPLSLGPRITSDTVRRYCLDADVVIGIGTEWSTFEGSVKGPIEITGKLIRIDIDSQKLVDRVPATVAIHADARLSAKGLLSLVEDAGQAQLEKAASLVADIRTASDAALPDLQKRHLEIGRIVRSTLPEDFRIVTDMTQIAYTFRANVGWEEPRRFLHPKGFGTLGYGLPAAIGAKAANPDSAVVVFVGDGGLMYTVGEMATASDEKLNVILIVWNNEALADIRDAFVDEGMMPYATSPKAPDFVMLGKAMGWNAMHAQSSEALEEALKAALLADKPSLIELREGAPF